VTILNSIAIGAAALAVGWGWKDYQLDHKPQFTMVLQEVMYDRCMRECEENQRKACELNGIPQEECKIDCSECTKIIDGKS